MFHHNFWFLIKNQTATKRCNFNSDVHRVITALHGRINLVAVPLRMRPMQLLSAIRRPAEVWSITFHQIRFNSVRLIKMAKQREQIRLMTMKLFQPFRGAVVRFFAFHLVLVLFSFIPLEGHLVWLVSLFELFWSLVGLFPARVGKGKILRIVCMPRLDGISFPGKKGTFCVLWGLPLDARGGVFFREVGSWSHHNNNSSSSVSFFCFLGRGRFSGDVFPEANGTSIPDNSCNHLNSLIC